VRDSIKVRSVAVGTMPLQLAASYQSLLTAPDQYVSACTVPVKLASTAIKTKYVHLLSMALSFPVMI
jgi:hypothetical protein